MTDSSFIGFTDAGDDVTIEVTTSEPLCAPQVVTVQFRLPNFTQLPNLYLSECTARALRVGLSAALAGLAPISEPFTRDESMFGPAWDSVGATLADAQTAVTA